MTTNAVISLFKPNLNRDMLNFWKKKGWICPTTDPSSENARKEKPRLYYPDAEVRKIAEILRGYAEGLTPKAAHERTQLPSRFIGAGLKELFSENENVLHSILNGELREALRSMAFFTRKLLKAEICSIFLVSKLSKDKIILEADSKEEPGTSHAGLTLNVRSDKGEGWTGHIAKTGDPFNLFGPELQNPEVTDNRLATHLKSPRTSLLAIPLKNRKGGLLGLIKVENKMPAARLMIGVFDQSDETLLATIASQLVLLIEFHRMIGTFNILIQEIHSASNFSEFSKTVVECTRELVDADRAEVTLWGENEKGEGQLASIAVAGDNKMKVGESIITKEPSISYSVFRNQTSRLEKNVLDARDYKNRNELTQSEIVVPVSYQRRPIGVLNIESDKLGGEGGLDERDLPLVEKCATYLSIAAQFVALRDSIYKDMLRREEGGPRARNNILKDILNDVTSNTVFDRGLIYIADFRRGVLQTAEFLGCKEEPLEIYFSATYLACKVVREKKPYFSRFPEKDPEVSPEGLRKYGIEGSLLGVPLIFETAVDPTVVGVLILWTEAASTFKREEIQEDIQEAASRARLAVAAGQVRGPKSPPSKG